MKVIRSPDKHGAKQTYPKIKQLINIFLDCPEVNYCPKYGVEYEGSIIVEGN